MRKKNLLIALIPVLVMILIIVISFLAGSRYDPEYSGPYQISVVEYNNQHHAFFENNATNEDGILITKLKIHYPILKDHLKYSTGQVLNNVSNFSSVMSNLQGLNWINWTSLILSQHANYKANSIQHRSLFPVIILPSDMIHLNTGKVDLAKELCSHGFITVISGTTYIENSIKSIESNNGQMIEEVIAQIEKINDADPENRGMMDLSKIGVLRNQFDEITLIRNIEDQRIKAIVNCDMETGQLHFPESSDHSVKSSFTNRKHKMNPFNFSRAVMKITKHIWVGATENMELNRFSERPVAKSVIRMINRIRDRFQQKKIKSLQSDIVNYFKRNLVVESEFHIHERWAGSHANAEEQNEDSSNSIGWIKLKISNE